MSSQRNASPCQAAGRVGAPPSIRRAGIKGCWRAVAVLAVGLPCRWVQAESGMADYWQRLNELKEQQEAILESGACPYEKLFADVVTTPVLCTTSTITTTTSTTVATTS